VAEHTDYGLLTILHQDHTGGLEVRTPNGWDDWVDVPVVPDTLVCNVGDMLDRMTAGRYRSTPHRVRSPRGRQRLSYAFFFDPAWDAKVVPVPVSGPRTADAADSRWDQASLEAFDGTYGEYLWAKVGRVFPALRTAVDPPDGRH
jgi:isopenicillin N synthase-like dioxygenase